jgi:mannose-6-phosphate isomerase-like protein (cupin superfamily)
MRLEMNSVQDNDSLTDVEAVERQRVTSGKSYLEFLRVASMSAGLYVLPVGDIDPQSSHAEDELYYVVRGRARFRSGEEHRTVGPGSLLFVAARESHRFYDILEELQVLVFFAPAETV